jgi:hypothetical protein
VHSLSHYCCFQLYPNAPGHGAQHAFLEREMIQHVVDSGWLVGKLKRPEMPKAPKEWSAFRYARVRRRIIVWTGKQKRADRMPRQTDEIKRSNIAFIIWRWFARKVNSFR